MDRDKPPRLKALSFQEKLNLTNQFKILMCEGKPLSEALTLLAKRFKITYKQAHEQLTHGYSPN